MPPPTFTVNSAMVNVNVKDTSKILYLPLANTIQGNTITIRDATGFCSPASSIYVSTLAPNSINNGLNTIRMTNPLQSLRLFSQPNNYQVTQNFIFPPPSIPTNLVLTINGTTRLVSLGWSPSINTNTYEWSFYATDLSNVTILSASTTNTFLQILPSIVLNTYYSFRVRAIGFGGTSAYAISPSVVYALPPDPPTNLSLTIVNLTGFTTMSWTGSAAAATYTWVLYRSATPPVIVSQNTTSVSLVTLTIPPVRGDYYFTVYASSAIGDSATVTLPTPVFYNPPPSNPSNLSLTIPNNTGLASMSWTASATNVTGYNWALYKVGTGTAVATGSTTTATTASYSVVNIPGDYYFTVTATGLGGSSDTIQSTPDTNYNPPPTDPTNLAISISNTTGVVTMSWTASLNAIDYTWSLYRDVSGSGSLVSTNTVSNSPATYTILSPFTPGNYYFIVRASGNGGFSQSVTSPQANYNPPPTNPSNLSLTINNSTGAVSMSWTASFNATSYSWIFRLSNGQAVTSGTTSGTSASYTFPSPFVAGNYYFTVQASGNGGTSNNVESSLVNYNPPPTDPTNLSLSIPNSTGLASMSWTASFNATSYTWTLVRIVGVTPTTVATNTTSGTSATYSLSPTFIPGNYYFNLVATGAGGSSNSVLSQLVNYNPPPTDPSSLSLTISNSTAAVSMSWTASVNVTSYSWIFYRATGNVVVTSGTTSGTSASYTILSPFVAGNYYFTVQATGAGGSSAVVQSSNVNYNPPPSNPSNLVLSISDSPTLGGVSMSWTASATNVTGYSWALVLVGTGTVRSGTTTGASSTTATANLSPTYTPGNYNFTVTATGAGGSSATITSSPNVNYNPRPTNPSVLDLAITNSTGATTLQWTASVNATSYSWFLYRDNTPSAGVLTLQGTTTSTTVNTSLAGYLSGTYYFSVYATGAGGQSDTITLPSIKWIVYNPPPTAATGLTLTINGSTAAVTMSWTAGANTASYTYLFYNASGPTLVTQATTANTSITISPSLTNGASYYFSLVSQNSAGSTSSGSSSTVQYRAIPQAPTGLTLTINNSTGAVSISWNASTFTTGGYDWIFYRVGTPNTIVTNGNTSSTSVSPITPNPTLVVGDFYFFQVRAKGLGGDSAYATSSNVRYTPIPAVPTITTFTINNTTGLVTMSWNAATNAVSYDWILNSLTPTTLVTNGTTTSLSVAISPTLIDLKSYQFQVRANGLDGVASAYATSSTVQYTPVPGTPTNLSLAISATTTIVLMSWTASSFAVSYDWNLFTAAGSSVQSANTSSTSVSTSLSLTENTSYYFTVVAKGNTFNSSTATSSQVQYIVLRFLPSDISNPAIWFDASLTANITSNVTSSNVTAWTNRGSITAVANSNASFTPPKTNQATQAGLNLITYSTSNNLIITSMSLPATSRSCFALYRQKVNFTNNGLDISFLRGPF
jgi:hypothetical protein